MMKALKMNSGNNNKYVIISHACINKWEKTMKL